MKKLRMGFVGCGFMGQLAHLENYYKLPNVEMVSLAEGREQLARRVAEAFGIQKIYRSHHELCNDDSIDAVCSVMGFGLNYGIVRDLLMAGKHVITEKAMCNTVDGARELIELAGSRNLIHHVGYMKRADPGVRKAVEIVHQYLESGEAGQLRYARIWCSHGDWSWQTPPMLSTDESSPDYRTRIEPRPAWMSEDGFNKVQSWLNYYSHQTNLLRYVLGEDYALQHANDDERGVLAIVKTPSGVPALLEFPYYGTFHWDEGFKCYFETAIIECSIPAPMARQQSARVTVTTNHGEPRVHEPLVRPWWSFAEQAKFFVASILDGGEQLCPGSEAIKEIEFADELVRRAQNSR